MFSPITTLYTYFPLQFVIRLTIDLLIAAFGVFLSVRLYKKGRFDKVQTIAGIILFVWGAFVLMLTVLGRRMNREFADNYYLELFRCYRMIFREHNRQMLNTTVQNIIMFVPIGFTLSLVFKNKHRVIIPIVISFGISLFIELCQLVLKSGFFELDDLFNNTAGSLIGVMIYMLVSVISKRILSQKRGTK